MAHGFEDYGASKAARTVHATTDMAEESVRVGAVSSVDRRGNVIEYDDFEAATMKWSLEAGFGTTVKSNAYARSGDYSVNLRTGAVEGDANTLSKYIVYPVPSRLGFEIWYRDQGGMGRINLEAEVRDQVDTYDVRLRYDEETNRLEYYDAAGAWQEIDTYAFGPRNLVFWPMKLVYDVINHQYVRALFMNYEYDLTGIPARRSGAGAAPHVGVTIETITLIDFAWDIYVDDFIFTQNEP